MSLYLIFCSILIGIATAENVSGHPDYALTVAVLALVYAVLHHSERK